MAKRIQSPEDPVFVVNLTRGLADRHRLPLEHVISVLSEVRQMLTDTGREVQRAHGYQNPDGDFGLELLASEGGLAFHQGSLEARIAITADKTNAMMAADLVLNTVDGLANRKLSQPQTNSAEARIIRRLNRIAKIHKTDKLILVLLSKDQTRHKLRAQSLANQLFPTLTHSQRKNLLRSPRPYLECYTSWKIAILRMRAGRISTENCGTITENFGVFNSMTLIVLIFPTHLASRWP